MNRRQFASLSLLMFLPKVKGLGEHTDLRYLLNHVINPFKGLKIDLYAIEEWVKSLPDTPSINVFAEYILDQIELDYIENRVVLVDGIVLSETEVKLYYARELYA